MYLCHLTNIFRYADDVVYRQFWLLRFGSGINEIKKKENSKDIVINLAPEIERKICRQLDIPSLKLISVESNNDEENKFFEKQFKK